MLPKKIKEFLKLLKNFFFSPVRYDGYASLNSKPGFIVSVHFGLYRLISNPKRFHEHLRWIRGNRRIDHPNNIQNIDLPLIELAINAVRKDFEVLPFVISYAVRNSVNPIKSITIAVPENEVEECEIYLKKRISEYRFSVISEDTFLSADFRAKLKSAMGWRYGWALQQFLTVERVLNSKSAGVLQVNADTLLLKPTIWLDQKGNQFLMESLEYHKNYYDLLEKIGLAFPKHFPTFITHHMLFQPGVFKLVLDKLQIRNVNELLDKVLEYSDLENISPFCVEFELYARGGLRFCPDKFEVIKFANASLDRSKCNSYNAEFDLLLENYSNNFNSVSLHSYL